MNNKKTVIFDCDPGHDDAIALIAALALPELDVRAVSVVHGNGDVENMARNALMVLELCGRADIPVAVGASKPIAGEFLSGREVHGETGMDGHTLPAPVTQASDLSAVEMMEKVVRESRSPVHIIATGALTNVAVFLLANPELAGRIACISVMGGACEEGNVTPAAEANIKKDPEACHVVFESGIPIELYGLNVTHKALILKDEFGMFKNAEGRVTRFVGDLLEFFAVHYTGRGGLPGCPIHDACAVLGLAEPRMFDYEYMRMRVDLYGGITRGSIAFDLRTEPRRDRPYTGKAAVDVDREEFVRRLFDCCESFGG